MCKQAGTGEVPVGSAGPRGLPEDNLSGGGKKKRKYCDDSSDVTVLLAWQPRCGSCANALVKEAESHPSSVLLI